MNVISIQEYNIRLFRKIIRFFLPLKKKKKGNKVDSQKKEGDKIKIM